jgi:hypothetical protein
LKPWYKAEGVLTNLPSHQVELKLKDMGFIQIRVHMIQGCVSVGMIPQKAYRQGKRFSSFLFFYPRIPSNCYGEKQNNMSGGGCAFQKNQNARQRGSLLFQTPTTHWRKKYNGTRPSNHTEK